jgi:tetrahydromethanopterin S-methyltransferase subunit B
MNVFQMVFGIVLASLIGAVMIMKQVVKLRRHEPTEHENQLTQKVSELEERIQILERIATDSKTSLKDKIDAL